MCAFALPVSKVLFFFTKQYINSGFVYLHRRKTSNAQIKVLLHKRHKVSKTQFPPLFFLFWCTFFVVWSSWSSMRTGAYAILFMQIVAFRSDGLSPCALANFDARGVVILASILGRSVVLMFYHVTHVVSNLNLVKPNIDLTFAKKKKL